jgi:hypothetical protein
MALSPVFDVKAKNLCQFEIVFKVRFYFERREDFGMSAASGETLRTK